MEIWEFLPSGKGQIEAQWKENCGEATRVELMLGRWGVEGLKKGQDSSEPALWVDAL